MGVLKIVPTKKKTKRNLSSRTSDWVGGSVSWVIPSFPFHSDSSLVKREELFYQEETSDKIRGKTGNIKRTKVLAV